MEIQNEKALFSGDISETGFNSMKLSSETMQTVVTATYLSRLAQTAKLGDLSIDCWGSPHLDFSQKFMADSSKDQVAWWRSGF